MKASTLTSERPDKLEARVMHTPGHTPAWETPVAQQRTDHLHVHDGVTEDEFVAMRTAHDRTLDMPTLMLPAVQVNVRAGPSSAARCAARSRWSLTRPRASTPPSVGCRRAFAKA